MPNWCSNYISVRGSSQAEIKRLADAFDAGELCQAVIPCPEDLNREGSSSHGGENAELYEQIRAENLEKHGYSNWYDFNVARWGTKWDINISGQCDRDDDGLGFSGSFDTAWSPPMGVVEKLMADGYEVTLYYYEPGMGFVGKYEDGCDDYYELGDLDSSTVIAAIGNELDDMFGISESMAEYEAEQEEDLTRWIREGAEERKELIAQ